MPLNNETTIRSRPAIMKMIEGFYGERLLLIRSCERGEYLLCTEEYIESLPPDAYPERRAFLTASITPEPSAPSASTPATRIPYGFTVASDCDDCPPAPMHVGLVESGLSLIVNWGHGRYSRFSRDELVEQTDRRERLAFFDYEVARMAKEKPDTSKPPEPFIPPLPATTCNWGGVRCELEIEPGDPPRLVVKTGMTTVRFLRDGILCSDLPPQALEFFDCYMDQLRATPEKADRYRAKLEEVHAYLTALASGIDSVVGKS